MNAQYNYALIVDRAIEYIEDNIFNPLSTVSIANAVGFSEYHFQRIFTSLLGDSPANYVRKRRLSEAALKLKNSKASIEDIAFQCQFTSKEAFTRSFSQLFRQTPGSYREYGPIDQPLLIPKLDLSTALPLRQGRIEPPAIVERSGEVAIGMADKFSPRSFLQINALWNRFNKRKGEITNARPGYELGIISTDQLQIKRTEEDPFIYFAALPVESITHTPEGMVSYELSSGRFARFTHKGKLSDFQHTVDYIWSDWVLAGDYELRDAPDFEIYDDDRFCQDSLDGEIDLYIPIV